ncbi:N-acetyltransferase [Pectobacterium aroidearum]|uniref:N-acetyltransferase n=1 Tax=Pectobacterium aroidearum TaxID=1201031 RepID=A0AAW3SZ59_9GAMM|nr:MULTISPECIES: N-acetyltransferase [Pectobacterium]MBA5201018.1 N-acetyltransferase [Pectobacterium aroidearum]MBA5204913.1 N-acetyltransferase [Pectobacterium aroidearum]MBA5229462.1 N-acetyltransferase [Pectobacterium aroidearum]MBA5233810.1 N-acetyltransferase [Pectobacterium aroidearum]MBA5738923.1 N-acetyltransferase [Pectobacterium aroidearum]
MIRPYCDSDLKPLMQLWLKSTILAHPFIREDYWRESASAVRDVYIPQSRTWVYEEQGSLIGFISVLEARFIGALFVEQAYYGKQIGTALIQHVQAQFPLLSLEVYQQNTRACRFYHKQGFVIVEENVNQDTQATALIMQWANEGAVNAAPSDSVDHR